MYILMLKNCLVLIFMFVLSLKNAEAKVGHFMAVILIFFDRNQTNLALKQIGQSL